MTRPLVALALSTFVAAAMVNAAKTYPCGAFVSAEPDGGGGVTIPVPATMECASDEEMVIAFVNKDDKAHRFQIQDIRCRDGNKERKDPTKNFIKKPIDVEAGATIRLSSGLFGLSKPKLRDSSELNGLKCDSSPYSYKYTVRVSAKGDNEGGKDLDPDLEVSPPSDPQPKTRKR